MPQGPGRQIGPLLFHGPVAEHCHGLQGCYEHPGNLSPPRAVQICTMRSAMRCLVALFCLAGAVAAEGVPLSDAQERLADLRTGLRHRKFSTPDLLELLSGALEPYGHVVADPLPSKKDGVKHKDWEVLAHEKEFLNARRKWHRALRDVLLDAMSLKRFKGKKKERVNDRHKLNVQAAKSLRKMPAGASKAIIAVFERHYMKIKDYTVDPSIFGAVFDTLAQRDEPGSFMWLRDEVMNEDARPQYRQRAEASLNALVRFPRISGRTRNETVRILIKTYEFIERQADFDGFGDAQALTGRKHTSRAKKAYWKTVGPLVIAALRHFATDPITKAAPVDYKRKKQLRYVADFARWYGRNKRRGRSPWRDPPDWKRKQ